MVVKEISKGIKKMNDFYSSKKEVPEKTKKLEEKKEEPKQPPSKTPLYKYENKLASYSNLTLTDKRLIKKIGDDSEEIPLNKISSIVYSSKLNKSLAGFGGLLAIAGLLLTQFKILESSISIILLVLGILIVIYCFIFTNQVVKFGSSSSIILTGSRGSEWKAFLEKVRKEIYK